MGRPAIFGKDPALRKKTNGIWEAVWLDPITGEKRRKSTGETDERKARAVLFQVARDARPLEPTIAELITRFLERKEKEGAEMPQLRSSLRPVSERLGHLMADQITQDDIDDYREWRLSQQRWEGDPRFEGKENLGTIADSTVSKDIRMLRACLNDAASRRYIASALQFRNPASESSPRTDWLTKEEVDKVLAACGEERKHLEGYILIAVTTGARKEAILELTWDQVYLPKGGVTPKEGVSPSGGFMELLSAKGQPYIDFGVGKGNKRRSKFAIGHNALLMNWLYFTADRGYERVITFRGEAIADIKKAFATVLKEAGIKRRITPHTLKHTAITWMMKAGVPVQYIADRVNTSEKVLLKTYGHHRPDFAAELKGIWD